MSDTVISYPIPAYSNVPINPQFYQPRRYIIAAISLGSLTAITTDQPMDYVVGQLVRLIIPQAYGSYQLNEKTGYIISIPTSTQVVINLNSTEANSFVPSPYTATITGATKANPCVLTANNSFVPGNVISISGVVGMTELNASNWTISSCNATSITMDVNSTSFTTYISGGTATLQTPIVVYPQIIAVGDINSGVVNSSGRTNNTTYVLGSFINISPQ